MIRFGDYCQVKSVILSFNVESVTSLWIAGMTSTSLVRIVIICVWTRHYFWVDDQHFLRCRRCRQQIGRSFVPQWLSCQSNDEPQLHCSNCCLCRVYVCISIRPQLHDWL